MGARQHPGHARVTARLTRQPEPVVERAYTVSGTRAVPLDDALVREFQDAVDRSVRYGIISRHFDVSDAIDRSDVQPSCHFNGETTDY